MARSRKSYESDVLRSAIDAMSGKRVVVIGDLILDRYIWGDVERISQEAPVPVVHVRRTEDRLGGAGLVVRNLCELGVEVAVCGYVGDDEAGSEVRAKLEQYGVSHEGVITDPDHPTPLKTRVIAHSQQVVRIDLEEPVAKSASCESALIASLSRLSGIDGVIVSDYGKGTLSEEVVRACTKDDPKIAPFVMVDPCPAHASWYRGVNVVKPNRKEAEAMTGIVVEDVASAEAASQKMGEQWQCDMILLSMGRRGMFLDQRSKDGVYLEAIAREVYDVSGAGDTVTAVFTAAVVGGADPELAGYLANLAAGTVVGEVGTVPVRKDALLNLIGQS